MSSSKIHTGSVINCCDISGMESSARLLSMGTLESEPLYAMIPRTLSPIQMPKSSFDRSNDHGSYSSDSGVGQDLGGRIASVEQNQNSIGVELPVKHVTHLGTQHGTLLQRYLIHRHSKCIVCKDCQIFFTYESFLGHSHDKHGRKRHRHQAKFLELNVENPDVQQVTAWQESLAKVGQKANPADSNLNSASFDSASRSREQPAHTEHMSTGRLELLRNDENMNTGDASLSDFDRNIRETVSASERLLRETSQYLHSSAEKLRHRRQRSLRNHQLRPKVLLPNDLTGDIEPSSLPSSEQVQPIIKDGHNTGPKLTRPNRKFLEKYLEKSRDSFQLLTDSLALSSSSKSDSIRVNSSANSNAESLQQPDPSTLRGEEVGGGVTKDVVSEGGGGDAGKATLGLLSSRPTSPRMTPQGKSIILQEHFDRNDPLFIVQTAQELLALAAHKMQERSQKSPGDFDWQKRYEVEREANKEKDKRIQELEGLLKEEKKKRQDAEVQLRAIRLQNL